MSIATRVGGASPWRIGWRLARPFTLTASVVPVAVGTAAAWAAGHWRPDLFAAMLFSSMLIQVGTNVFNEYYDYVRGLDAADSVGIAGAIVRDGVRPATVLVLACAAYGAALALGLYICATAGWWVLPVGALSMIAGFTYTGGPYPLAYTPFGEAVVAVFMGPVIVVLAYFVQSGSVAWPAVLLSVPVALLVAGLLTANNIRDHVRDRERGRDTLAIRLGPERAIRFLGAICFAAEVWAVGLVLLAGASPWLLAVLLSLPKAAQVVRRFRGGAGMRAMLSMAQLHAQFGLLCTLGLVLGRALS